MKYFGIYMKYIRVDIDDRGNIELCRAAGKKKYIYDIYPIIKHMIYNTCDL